MVIGARRKALHLVFAILIGLGLLSAPSSGASPTALAAPSPPVVRGDAALLMDLRTGQVLYALRPDAREYPASTTKILTGIIALELGSLDDMVTADDDVLKAEGTRIYLEPGEQETLRDLLYAMLLNSANDAAVAIADHIAGNTGDFARLMNAVAAKVGATGSHFVNPSGLTDKNHYTTARDLALIARYAMHNPTFAAIVGTKTYTMPWPEKDDVRQLANQNRFLSRYDYATGVKPGYTSQAKDTLVASASKDGVDLLAVILRASGSTIWKDAAGLMDYGLAIAPKTVKAVPPGEGLAAAAVKDLGLSVATAAGTPPRAPGDPPPAHQTRPFAGPVWRGVLAAGVPMAALTTLAVAWAARRPRARRRRVVLRRVTRRGRVYVHRSIYRSR